MSRSPRLLFAASAVAVMVLVPLPGGFDVFDTSIFLIGEDASQDEDAYVLSQTAIIDGVVDGDLVIATNSLRISGVVNGDVLLASDGKVTISGTIHGALRGVAREVVIEETGVVRDDIAVAAVTTRVLGEVGRDAIVFGGKLQLTGVIGRDLHGRFVTGRINGEIGRNTDFATSALEVGAATVVGGSLLYRSNREADTEPGADVAGTFARLSPQPSFFVNVWLTLATILGFVAFVLTGIVVIWLLRDTSSRAVRNIVDRPWRTLLVGIVVLFAVPLIVLTLVRSLVGIPVAVLLGVLYLLGLFFGPIPAVAAAGRVLSRGRIGVFGAFVVGAVVWRLGIALVTFVAGGLYLAALIWGTGGWAVAVWEARRRTGSYSINA